MTRGIIKLGDNQYVEWSTVCDAPTTYIMTREQMVMHCGDENRVIRADLKGTSYLDNNSSAKNFIAFNRAGQNESCLTLEEMIKEYTQND